MYNFITGKVKFIFKSLHYESVINRLRHSVPIYSIKKIDYDRIELVTGYRYKSSVSGVLNDIGVQIETVTSSGIPAFVDRYKKRIGLWIGFVLSMVALFVSSMMIWEIRISGNTYVPDSDIVRLLKQLGIAEGCFIDKNILETTYNDFLIKEPRISWISVNYDGTIAKVEVMESKIVPEVLDRNRNINIVSKSDGIIKRVDVFDGKSEVAIGEAVTKGQLLISSFTESRKTGVFMRAARGNVWASTVHNYEIVVNKAGKVYGNSELKNSHSIIVLGNRIPLYLQSKPKNINQNIYVDCKRYLLFECFPLPFRIETKKRLSYDVNNAVKNDETAKEKADKELACRIEKDLINAEIIERNESFYEDENAFVFKYELSCVENIASSLEFEFE